MYSWTLQSDGVDLLALVKLVYIITTVTVVIISISMAVSVAYDIHI